MYMDIQAQGV